MRLELIPEVPDPILGRSEVADSAMSVLSGIYFIWDPEPRTSKQLPNGSVNS